MAAHAIERFEDLERRSIDDPDWFWDAVVKFLDIDFSTSYRQVLDVSDGIPWARWFVGGETNFAHVAVDRHPPERTAIVWEGEDGEVRTWTYGELRSQADGLAALLVERGIGHGDAVGVFMPMIPETVAALLGIAKVGAVFLPLFSGYGDEAIASRLNDAGAKVIVTAESFQRRGKQIPMSATAKAAVAQVPTLELVVEVPDWPAPASEPFATRMVDSEHPLFIAYTSGTTGRPKGAVQVHAGWTVKVAEEGAFQTDVGPDDTLFWFTDMGWIMGPWEVTAALVNGATLALYEGGPDYPAPDRLWAYIEHHRVTVLGISPTLVRALMPHGDEPVNAHDLSSLRVLGSTGEPWNEGPWRWYFEVVGGGRCPVINISGGTEVGACFLSPHPVRPIKPMSLGGPALGMAVDVYDDLGRPVRGAVGELVCTAPWPGMTRGLYKDPERYMATYWSRWPDVWVHGDWASIDEDGDWFLHGRSDDTLKVAGKRLGPAEIESILAQDDAVAESAAVGVPHSVKGEVILCFVVLRPGYAPGGSLRSALRHRVAEAMGKPFTPEDVRFVAELPKTRSGKILRRVIQRLALNEDPGDL